jgi:UDP-glucose 4-epimerase
MLVFSDTARPDRTVILGSGGFIAGAVAGQLARAGASTLGLGRRELDLLAEGADRRLADLLRPTDALLVVSAKAPCKNESMFLDNIRMAAAVASALRQTPVAHVVYISSDAVYADSDEPLTEISVAAPDSLHGAMHLSREIILRSVLPATPYAVLRPTLVYGAADPHNGYGPNRFLRQAIRGETVPLFGDGEERRDHVHVEDVAEVVCRTLLRRGAGILNIASGEVASFAELAQTAIALAGGRSQIQSLPRNGPMPHRGFRPFAIDACRKAFPDLAIMRWPDGLAQVHQTLLQQKLSHG